MDTLPEFVWFESIINNHEINYELHQGTVKNAVLPSPGSVFVVAYRPKKEILYLPFQRDHFKRDQDPYGPIVL